MWLPPQYSLNKGFAEDLTEGKFSFPIVHGIRTDMSNRQILSKITNSVHRHPRFSRRPVIHNRCPAEETDDPDAEEVHHILPTRSNEVFRVHALSDGSSGEADLRRNLKAWWQPSLGAHHEGIACQQVSGIRGSKHIIMQLLFDNGKLQAVIP